MSRCVFQSLLAGHAIHARKRSNSWSSRNEPLLHDNRDAWFHHPCKFCDVPIGKADASMTCITSDGIGVARAMNANALLIERYPYDTRWIVRPGGSM